MRMVLGSALLFCLVAGVSADDKIDTQKLVGKWKLSDPTMEGVTATIELTADGKVNINLQLDKKMKTRKGTYKVEGNKLIVTYDDKATEKMTVTKLTDTELVTEDEKGKKDTLKRVEEKK